MAKNKKIYVAYCGGKWEHEGNTCVWKDPQKSNVEGVLCVHNDDNSDDELFENNNNPTDADAYIYEIKDGVKTLHVFESPCKPYMTCTYDGTPSNKIISNQDNIWQKIVIDDNSAQTRVMSSYYEFSDKDYRIGKYGQDDIYEGFIDRPITVRFYFANSGNTEDERENGDMVSHTNEGMFSGCTSLVSCNVPCQMRTISKNTFSGCTSLTSYTENPNFIDTIGEYAFTDCESLPKLVIGEPTIISEGSFMNCKSISTIKWDFQSHITKCRMSEIPASAFTNCTNLTTTEFSNQTYQAVAIPNGIKDVKDCAFSGCTRMKELIFIFNSVSGVTNQAFENCTSISSITGFDNVTHVGERAFYSAGTNNQNAISGFGDLGNLTFIGPEAFSYVKFDSGLTINVNVPHDCFNHASGGAIIIENGCYSIGPNAFNSYTFIGPNDMVHIVGTNQVARSTNSFDNSVKVMLDDYAGTSLNDFCGGYYKSNNWESCVFFNNAGQVIQ